MDDKELRRELEQKVKELEREHSEAQAVWLAAVEREQQAFSALNGAKELLASEQRKAGETVITGPQSKMEMSKKLQMNKLLSRTCQMHSESFWKDFQAKQSMHLSDLSENAAKLLTAVYAQDKGGIMTENLSEMLDVTPTALGPIISEITQWAASRGHERKDIILKLRKNVNGKPSRIYKPGKLLKGIISKLK